MVPVAVPSACSCAIIAVTIFCFVLMDEALPHTTVYPESKTVVIESCVSLQ